MSFKFLKGKEDNLNFILTNQVALYRYNPENVDFCFQFNDDEPITFATGPNECHIRISPQPDGSMAFNDANGNVFKIFARERNDA